jgi:hypothetical protein
MISNFLHSLSCHGSEFGVQVKHKMYLYFLVSMLYNLRFRFLIPMHGAVARQEGSLKVP